ncbi:MAG: nucleotidyltransferase family protein [Vicinamibacterales bacterium]
MAQANESHITQTLADVLRAIPAGDRAAVTRLEPDYLLCSAITHGVVGLLFERVCELGLDATPAVERLREYATAAAVWELRHQQVLGTTLTQFAQAGIQPILLKGTALAYSLYTKPLLRSRGDTDLLVRDDQKEEAAALLAANGFERRQTPSGQFISYQDSYSLRAKDSTVHVIDLHWQPMNSVRLSRVFNYDELLQRAVPLPKLGRMAKGPGAVDALLIACVHRLTHVTHPYFVGDTVSFDADRLIWLYDIHLLSESLEPVEWHTAVALAQAKSIGSILLNGLAAAHTRFDTAYPTWVADALVSTNDTEPLHEHLASGPITQYAQTLKTMDSLADRVRFLKELLLPSSEYMRGGYEGGRNGWMPLLYARRIMRGGLGKMKQERSRRRSERAADVVGHGERR